MTICKHPKTEKESLKNFTANSLNLPLLVSVPHGGYTIPAELKSLISLDFYDIFADSDPCTRQIFDFKDEVYSFHDAEIARAVIDLNRHQFDLPPHNPDGVVKSHTVRNKKVYRDGYRPNPLMTHHLLDQYYFPYHRNIANEMNNASLLCGLDCHTMLEFPPPVGSPDHGERPFICLSNFGDLNGDGDESGLSCPPALIRLLADCLCSVFPEHSDSITMNTPFKGGHISLFHSRDMPWIQIELNRNAYLNSPWFNAETLQVESYRLEYLRKKFLNAFVIFCDEALNMQFLQNSNQRSQSSFSNALHT